MGATFTDIFCGAGGSSIGLTAAGWELKLAANHWQRAIDTHAANFPAAEHVCADVNNYDMRRLPKTDVLWASPICTEASPAGGRTGRAVPTGQGDLLQELGHVPRAGFERTRATFHDVIRATEVHRYAVVLVENVPDVVRWELFDWWCQGMCHLGYRMQTVSVSSAHVGGTDNPYAPQWRDRLYLVFTRTGIPLPDVTPTPAAWCPVCEVDVAAVQVWKKPAARRVGKYRRQYHYLCPNQRCRNTIVEPYVLPAATAIDWTDLGQRIGERDKPLAAKTLARIQAGLAMFTGHQSLITLNHADGHSRAVPVRAAPLPTRTAKVGEGLLTPGMLVPAGGTWNDAATCTGEPMRTRTAREAEALVTGPFIGAAAGHIFEGAESGYRRVWPAAGSPLPTRTATTTDALVTPEAFVAVLRNHGGAHDVVEPFRTMTAGGHHHALVIPYRKDNRPATTASPLQTMATRDSAALVQPSSSVQDCRFRMLRPREQLRAQRFPDSYTVAGNIAEQTMQAGNAVSANVAQWLAQQVTAALDIRSKS